MKARILTILILIFILTGIYQDRATAWGPVTHMTILDDMLKDPRLDSDVKKILQENLKYAKGGVVGPDMYYFSNKRYSDIAHYCSPGDLARKMLEMAKKDGDPKKIAFAFGWVIHVATDPIGHGWVNSLAGGEYDPNNSTIKKQHRHIEQSIDKKNFLDHSVKIIEPITGESLLYLYDMNIDSPNDFVSTVFSNFFRCKENSPGTHEGEIAENISQLLYNYGYPYLMLVKDENKFNTAEYMEAYQKSITTAIEALNSYGGTLENWDLDSGEAPYIKDENGQVISNSKYNGHVKCKDQGKLKDCGPVTRRNPGGDHPDDTVSVGDYPLGSKTNYLDSLYRLAPKKEKEKVLWLKKIKDANTDYSNLPSDVPPELRIEKLNGLLSLTHQLNDPFDWREFSENNSQLFDEIEETPDIAILQNGFFEEMATLINKHHEPVRIVEPGFSPEIHKIHPVLVIPSGGLYGMDKSEFFKVSLDEYVKQGGTLIVFTQQHGYEFSVLPVPQEPDGSYNKIGGYGWSEDVSCFAHAAYIETWHPILGSQVLNTPSIHLDGYFVTYPSNAQVILRRTVNGQPALLMYEYGQGRVILTTMYSDFALKQNQASSEEIALVRDMISWAKRPTGLSEIRPGGTITVEVETKNITAYQAASIKFIIYNPSRSTLIAEQEVSLPIPPNESVTVPVAFTASSSSALGIYHIDYILLDAEGKTIQPQAETDSGRFVVSKPPRPYSQIRQMDFSIISEKEQYVAGEIANFTILVFNRSDAERTISVRFGKQNRIIVMPPQGINSFSYSKIASADYQHWGQWWSAEQVSFYEETNRIGALTKWYRVYPPSASVSIETEKRYYKKGETVIIKTSLHNKIPFSWNANFKITVYSPKNAVVFEELKSVILPPSGIGSASTNFILPSELSMGTYSIYVEVPLSDVPWNITIARTWFELPDSQIIVSPNLPTFLNPGTNWIPVSISNKGKLNVSLGTIDVTLRDPHGNIVHSESAPFSLMMDETKILDIPINIPHLLLGTYILTYTQSDEIRVGKPTEITIPNSIAFSLSLDQGSYKIREEANLRVEVTNTGKFNLENISVIASLKEANFSEIKEISLIDGSSSTQLEFKIPIPATIAAGHHQVEVVLNISSGSSLKHIIYLSVLPSELKISYSGATVLSMGDSFNLSITNAGGHDTEITYKVTLAGNNSNVLQSIGDDSLLVGETKNYSFRIPSQVTDGNYILMVEGVDKKTNQRETFWQTLKISGLTAGLKVWTNKDIYLSSESMVALSELINHSYNIENGYAHLQIINRCRGGIPASYHIYTWDGSAWINRAILHYPNTLGTHLVDLSPFLPDPTGEYKVRIRHSGEEHAEIDYIGLVGGGVFYRPSSVLNLNTNSNILSFVSEGDDWTTNVLNNEVEVKWTHILSSNEIILLMRAQEGEREYSPCIEKIYWQAIIPITQPLNTTLNLNYSVPPLFESGQFYLQGQLVSRTGQVINKAEYPFNVVTGNLGFRFQTDKFVYKQGETIHITGSVINLGLIEATNVMVRFYDDYWSILYEGTFDIPQKGSRPFNFSITAGPKGIYQLQGYMTQNMKGFIYIVEKYEVDVPNLSVSVDAPSVVGNDLFPLNVILTNKGKVSATEQIAIRGGSLSDHQNISIGPNETQLIQYFQTIASDTTYTINILGDLNETITHSVSYGLGAALQFGNGNTELGVFPEGIVPISITATNIGPLAKDMEIIFQLDPGNLKETRIYHLATGMSMTDLLYFNLTEGDYKISAFSQKPDAFAEANFSVKKENQLGMALSLDPQPDGPFSVSIELMNLGFNEINGSLMMNLIGESGQIVWNGEEVVSQLGAQTSQVKRIHLNPSSFDPGHYTLQMQLLNNSNQLLVSKNQSFTVQSPAFQITQLPPYQTFYPGEEGTFTFNVKNIGGQVGEFNLRLKAYDLVDSTQRGWLKPGEEITLIYRLTFPEDLEEKDYFAEYELRNLSDKHSKSLTGQIKYHLTGIAIVVQPRLDKPFYSENETLHLTLDLQTMSSNPQNLFARVHYGRYESQQTFILNGRQILIFDVPLAEITGEKLFYGIYHESGRSIHLNSVYVHKADHLLTITTDKQVYSPGETVTVNVFGNVSGRMTLSGPGRYMETFDFSNSAFRSFALPLVLNTGTYSVDVELMTHQSELIYRTYPFDVAGIQVKVLECQNDKGSYAPYDVITTTLTISSNTTMPALLKAWIVDPTGEHLMAGEQIIGLSSNEHLLVNLQSVAMTPRAGIHRFVFGIYGPEDLLLCSGSEAFDVGGTLLLGISTNNKDYPTPTEPVIVTVHLYGIGEAELSLELDGTLMQVETISLQGLTSYVYELQGIMPGLHSLKATLTPLAANPGTGKLGNSQEIRFTYAFSSISRPQILVSPFYFDFGSVNLSKTATQPLLISSSGNTDLLIGTIRLSESLQGEFSIQNDNCSGRTIIPSGSCTLDIIFSPSSLGVKSGSLIIPSNATETPNSYLSISGTGITALTVKINPENSGNVTGTGIDCPGDCLEYFSTSEASLQLTAAPKEGYQFVNWTGDILSIENPVIIQMENNRHITANFKTKTYSIVATVGIGGSITPSGIVTVSHGDTQTFTITPHSGYHIADVKVDGHSMGSLNSFTFQSVTSNHTIEAIFATYNIPPIADAGPDQHVMTGQVVKLDGSDSFDPEGAMITFLWRFIEVPPGSNLSNLSLSDPTSAMLEFTPDVSGTYRLELIVNDGGLDSLPDEVLIHAFIPNVPPNAHAGSDQHVFVGNMVHLDGSKSWDPDNGPSPLSYLWSFVAKPSQSLLTDQNIGNKGSVYASFIPDVSGLYEFRLTVNDGEFTSEDTVNIIATLPNVPPHAHAGEDKTIYLGETVNLDGSGSHDPDQGPQPLTYLWTFVTVPAGSALGNREIIKANAVSPSFTPDIAGTYVLQLMVYDGKDAGFDNVAIIVISDNTPPTLAPIVNMTTLWPPNHQMVKITIQANASDNTSYPVVLSAKVTSNEPQNGLGDGDTSPDWTEPIIDQANGIITLNLRAERSGKGNGRIYTITITATDLSGNSRQADVVIKVPRNRGGK